jgi:hypothetical protein
MFNLLNYYHYLIIYDYFSGRGSLLPRPLPMAGKTLLTVRVEKIGLKDASQFIDPFITVSVKGQSGFWCLHLVFLQPPVICILFFLEHSGSVWFLVFASIFLCSL